MPNTTRTCHPRRPDLSCPLCRASAVVGPKKASVSPGPTTAKSGRVSLPCVHLGGKVPGEPCGSTLMTCTHFGDVTTRFVPCSAAKRCCKGCDAYALATPKWADGAARWDETTLYPELPGRRFNPGLIEWEEGGTPYVFCWRDGWAGSNLWCCRMDAAFRPTGKPVLLPISHPMSGYGREDPQLFVHAGKLHVAFVGVQGRGNRVVRTNVLYARLGPNFAIEAVHHVVPPGVPPERWQKNWQWFESGGELYATYSVSPEYRVLRVRGGHAEWAVDEKVTLPWVGGEVRGGATPYFLNGRMYSFFHDSVDVNGRKLYRTGCYTFEPAFPFRITACTKEPVVAADPSTQPTDNPNYCDTVFTRGVVVDGDDWIISSGEHDRRTRLDRISIKSVDAALVPIN